MRDTICSELECNIRTWYYRRHITSKCRVSTCHKEQTLFVRTILVIAYFRDIIIYSRCSKLIVLVKDLVMDQLIIYQINVTCIALNMEIYKIYLNPARIPNLSHAWNCHKSTYIIKWRIKTSKWEQWSKFVN